jgi:hypothetical protein
MPRVRRFGSGDPRKCFGGELAQSAEHQASRTGFAFRSDLNSVPSQDRHEIHGASICEPYSRSSANACTPATTQRKVPDAMWWLAAFGVAVNFPAFSPSQARQGGARAESAGEAAGQHARPPGPMLLTATPAALVLRLQLRFIGSDERPNLVRHIQQFQPLFLVQSHGKAAHAIDRQRSLYGTSMPGAGAVHHIRTCRRDPSDERELCVTFSRELLAGRAGVL